MATTSDESPSRGSECVVTPSIPGSPPSTLVDPIMNTVLCALKNRRASFPKRDIVMVMSRAFDLTELKESLAVYLSALPNNSKGNLRRVKPNTAEAIVSKILDLMSEDEKKLPKIYIEAQDLARIPGFSGESLDYSHLINRCTRMSAEYSDIKTSVSNIESNFETKLSQLQNQLNTSMNQFDGLVDNFSEKLSELSVLSNKLLDGYIIERIRHIGEARVHVDGDEGHPLTPPSSQSDAGDRVVHAGEWTSTPSLSPSPVRTPLTTESPSPPPRSTQRLSAQPDATTPDPPLTPPKVGVRECHSTPIAEQNFARAVKENCSNTEHSVYATPCASVNTLPSKKSSVRARAVMSSSTPPCTDNEGFMNVSDLRRKKSGVKRGTAPRRDPHNATAGLSKLFVSLPYRNVKIHFLKDKLRELGCPNLTCKRRNSSSGRTSPFEVYGKTEVVEKLYDASLWDAGSFIKFRRSHFLLPSDFADDDLESERKVLAASKGSLRYRSKQRPAAAMDHEAPGLHISVGST